MKLREQFNGNYGYTMIGNSLSEGPNSSPGFCSILDESSANLDLPENVRVSKAYLYYAASGYTIEDVSLNGITPNFLYATTLTSSFDPTVGHFFAKADVTEIIRNQGDGEYTFSGLESLNSVIFPFCWAQSQGSGGPCPSQGSDFAGWAICIVYESDELPHNSITLFDGYTIAGIYQLPRLDVNTSDVSNSSVSFLAWEGDYGGANEFITLNGEILENDLNFLPQHYFNHTNSFANQEQVWNMDLDYFDTSSLTDSSTEFVEVEFTSAGMCADGVFIQVAVVEIENRLPNPGIELIDAQPGICGDEEIELTYQVLNTNTTETLPAGVPINFYKATIDRPLLETTTTSEELAPNASYTASITLQLDAITLDFTEIEAVINKAEDGQTVIPELNPEDNTSEIRVEELGKPQLFFANVITPDQNDINDEFFLLNRERCRTQIENFSLSVYNRYGEAVFNTTDLETNWDGTDQNGLTLEGTFLYYVTYQSATNSRWYEKSGVVTLIY